MALASCATTAEPMQDGRVTVSLNEPARFGRFELVPLRIVEDSRCPTEVVCIQAGTVRLAVRSNEGGPGRDWVLKLGEPQPLTGGGFLELAAVCPFPRQPGPIAPAAYRFTLAFGANALPEWDDTSC